jgi:hypothetical protein
MSKRIVVQAYGVEPGHHELCPRPMLGWMLASASARGPQPRHSPHGKQQEQRTRRSCRLLDTADATRAGEGRWTMSSSAQTQRMLVEHEACGRRLRYITTRADGSCDRVRWKEQGGLARYSSYPVGFITLCQLMPLGCPVCRPHSPPEQHLLCSAPIPAVVPVVPIVPVARAVPADCEKGEKQWPGGASLAVAAPPDRPGCLKKAARCKGKPLISRHTPALYQRQALPPSSVAFPVTVTPTATSPPPLPPVACCNVQRACVRAWSVVAVSAFCSAYHCTLSARLTCTYLHLLGPLLGRLFLRAAAAATSGLRSLRRCCVLSRRFARLVCCVPEVSQAAQLVRPAFSSLPHYRPFAHSQTQCCAPTVSPVVAHRLHC